MLSFAYFAIQFERDLNADISSVGWCSLNDQFSTDLLITLHSNEVVHGVERRIGAAETSCAIFSMQFRKDRTNIFSTNYRKNQATKVVQNQARGCHCRSCLKKKRTEKEGSRKNERNKHEIPEKKKKRKKEKEKEKKRQATNSKPPWNLQQSSGPQGSWSSIRVAISSLYGVESSRKGLKGLGGGQETDSRLPSAAHAPLPRCLHTRTRG